MLAQLVHVPALRPVQPVLYLPALQLGQAEHEPGLLPPQLVRYWPEGQPLQELQGELDVVVLYLLLCVCVCEGGGQREA